jgi:hypothetical protein
MIINLLKIIITSFIRYVLSCIFVREHSKVDKMKNTLQTMLPSNMILRHQYHARNYHHYLDLICDLLQAEKHDVLTLKNHH